MVKIDLAKAKIEVRCGYDGCHIFSPGSVNGKYCPTCKCKRKMENSKKRLSEKVEGDEDLWRLQEERKLGRLLVQEERNWWLLENKRIGFFDIETTNLSANIGMILCASVKERGGPTKTFVCKKKRGLLSDEDTVDEIREELTTYDFICTYYGTKFDIPYLNTRLLIADKPLLDAFRHVDMYYTARYKLKLHSNRLQVVQESLLEGKTEKTKLIGPIWQKAAMGDKESLEYIVEHCEADVQVLEDVFDTLKMFVNLSGKRIYKLGAAY